MTAAFLIAGGFALVGLGLVAWVGLAPSISSTIHEVER